VKVEGKNDGVRIWPKQQHPGWCQAQVTSHSCRYMQCHAHAGAYMGKLNWYTARTKLPQHMAAGLRQLPASGATKTAIDSTRSAGAPHGAGQARTQGSGICYAACSDLMSWGLCVQQQRITCSRDMGIAGHTVKVGCCCTR
jgi:hypothetical protein